MEQEADPSPECSQCSVPVRNSDLVLRDHGQLYHAGCAGSSTSDERVTEGRKLRRTRAARSEPPAVLCEICGTGIGSAAELAMTASGPTHVHCRPTG
jgi:hypothetical protein